MIRKFLFKNDIQYERITYFCAVKHKAQMLGYKTYLPYLCKSNEMYL